MSEIAIRRLGGILLIALGVLSVVVSKDATAALMVIPMGIVTSLVN